MSLEAVPCVLKQSDGSPVYGLLIRPIGPATSIPPPTATLLPPPTSSAATSSATTSSSSSAPILHAAQPRPAPISPRLPTNVPPSQLPRPHKFLLPAPPPLPTKDSTHQQLNGNVFIPASAVQQYQANRGYPEARAEGEMDQGPESHSSSLPSTSTTYSHATTLPSASHDLNTSTQSHCDHYARSTDLSSSIHNSMQYNRNNSQNSNSLELTSLLEDINSSDLASLLADSEKMLSSDCTLLDSGAGSSQQEHNRALNMGYRPSTSRRPPCRFSGEGRSGEGRSGEGSVEGGEGEGPRPQLGWERGPSESASTPDSGIQSISGGSPSNSTLSPGAQFSPNLPHQSPALLPTIEPEPSCPPDTASEGQEFNDMPQLIPEGHSAQPSESLDAPSSPRTSSPIPPPHSALSLGQKVDSMDEKFEQVCLRVLKGGSKEGREGEWRREGEARKEGPKPGPGKKARKKKGQAGFSASQPVASKGPPKVTEAANQTSSSPSSSEKNLLMANAMSPQPPADPKILVEKLLNQLEPTQLQQFTRLFEEKLKQTGSHDDQEPETSSTKDICSPLPLHRSPDEDAKETKPSAADILRKRRERAKSPRQVALLRKLELQRRKTREIINPVIETALGSVTQSLTEFQLGTKAEAGGPNCLVRIAWERVPCVVAAEEAARRAAIARSQAAVANLELEAAESEQDLPPLSPISSAGPASPLQLTPPPIPTLQAPLKKGRKRAPTKPRPAPKPRKEGKEEPVSLKVRLSLEGLKLKLPETEVRGVGERSLPPKKRLAALLAGTESEPEKGRKRRRSVPYPWDRKKRKEERVKPNLIRRCRRCQAWTRLDKLCGDDNLTCLQCLALPSSPRLTHPLSSPRPPKIFLSAGLMWNSESSESFATGFHVDPSLIPSEPADFTLPFPLWQHHVAQSPDPDSKKLKPKGKRRSSGREVASRIPCRCLPPSQDGDVACGPNCLNRIMFTECDPQFCPCGEACTNQQFRKKSRISELHKFHTGSKRGFGVRTTTPIHKGSFICEYAGKHVSSAEFSTRMATIYKEEAHHYALSLDSGTIIDAYRSGNLSRFVNHSCEPNCEMQKWSVKGQWRMGLFALTHIPVNTELTYDYKFASFNVGQECLCGSSGCRGRIGVGAKKAPFPPAPLTARDRATVLRRRFFLLRNYHRVRPLRSDGCRVTAQPRIGALLNQTKEAEALGQLGAVLCAIYQRAVGGSGLPPDLLIRPKRKLDVLKKAPKSLHALYKALIAGSYTTPAPFLRDLAKLLRALNSKGEVSEAGLEQALIRLRGGVQAWSGSGLVSVGDAERLGEVGKGDGLLTTASDLSYLDDGECPVGSYDPDDVKWGSASGGEDKVRCVCGVVEEEGGMVACDECGYWQHQDCVGAPQGHYLCHFCSTGTQRIPSIDIPLQPQPSIALKGCTYYRALCAPSTQLQLRVNEAIYVVKKIGEGHKETLRRLHEECVEPKGGSPKAPPPPSLPKKPLKNQSKPKLYSRHHLRIFRIERLFKAPNGDRFVFGWYYARPHETFCEPTRRFYRNELFCTPLYDTLPVEAVVGRCGVMEPGTAAKGRPLVPALRPPDLYVCELRLDKAQRLFERLGPKSRTPTNTQSHVFAHHPARLKLRRDFTPFVYPTGSGLPHAPPVPSTAIRDKIMGNINKEKINEKKKKLERVVSNLANTL